MIFSPVTVAPGHIPGVSAVAQRTANAWQLTPQQGTLFPATPNAAAWRLIFKDSMTPFPEQLAAGVHAQYQAFPPPPPTAPAVWCLANVPFCPPASSILLTAGPQIDAAAIPSTPGLSATAGQLTFTWTNIFPLIEDATISVLLPWRPLGPHAATGHRWHRAGTFTVPVGLVTGGVASFPYPRAFVQGDTLDVKWWALRPAVHVLSQNHASVTVT